jgi:CDP-diacylglycerol--glycerol-3-phosphate 3-phosphatidyltransferase
MLACLKNYLSSGTLTDLPQTQQITFTDKLRRRFGGVADGVARFLNNLGIHPDVVTLFGMLGHVLAAYLAARGWISWSGVTLALLAPLDFIDGTMARLRGVPSRFGAFFDSVIDRYSELIIMGGLLIYYLYKDPLACVLVYLVAAGSVLVPYTRARAEALGYELKAGLLSRVERYLVLIPALVFNIPLVGLWIMAVLTNITAVQRIWIMRKMTLESNKPAQESSKDQG